MNIFKTIKQAFGRIKEDLPSLETVNEEVTKETFPEGMKRKMSESKQGRTDRMLLRNHKKYFFDYNNDKVFVIALNHENAVRKIKNLYPDIDISSFNIDKI